MARLLLSLILIIGLGLPGASRAQEADIDAPPSGARFVVGLPV